MWAVPSPMWSRTSVVMLRLVAAAYAKGENTEGGTASQEASREARVEFCSRSSTRGRREVCVVDGLMMDRWVRLLLKRREVARWARPWSRMGQDLKVRDSKVHLGLVNFTVFVWRGAQCW